MVKRNIDTHDKREFMRTNVELMDLVRQIFCRVED